jgi:hypothetical protein
MQKLAFVLLIAIALVFALGVGLGANRKGPGGRPWWATFAQDWFVREEPLEPRDVNGECVGGGGRTIVFHAGASCTVTIARRKGALIRNMTLELSDGLKVKGTLKPRGRDAGPVSITLQSRARTLKLPIVQDGATLELQCAAPSPATLACLVAVH